MLKVFESAVLRKVFEPKRNKVTGDWRRVHNEELHDLYTSPNIIQVIRSRRMSWMGHVACMGERSGAYSILVEQPEGRRPLGRQRHRGKANVKMDFKDTVWGAWTGFMWLMIYTSGRLLWIW
jgi:hypothetical protein